MSRIYTVSAYIDTQFEIEADNAEEAEDIARGQLADYAKVDATVHIAMEKPVDENATEEELLQRLHNATAGNALFNICYRKDSFYYVTDGRRAYATVNHPGKIFPEGGFGIFSCGCFQI